VLDAAIATVVESGYYRASSNAIARRAGVSWGVIQYLFGSREQLMLDVVNDIGLRLKDQLAAASIEGETLEERLRNTLDVLSVHYEHERYLVQIEILLDLSTSPTMPARRRRELRTQSGQEFDDLAQPLLEKALGPVAAEPDLCLFVFTTIRGYLTANVVARLVADMPDDVVLKLMANRASESDVRDLLVRSLGATLRKEGAKRGYRVR
jgi:AcrR family transcriptional regulator